MAAVAPPAAGASTDASCACVAPDLSWIQTLPKVDMHAHLSGSVKDSTIRAMLCEEAEANGSDADASTAAATAPSCLSAFISGERTLSQCFEVFALLHRLLSSLEAVARVTREVISDFAADEVVYLELRTTPRALPAKATSKRQYVQTVVDAIREWTQADAESTVDLAAEFAAQPDPVVVGLDFSGNPTVSSFRAFQHHFVRARNLGLKCSVHVGEKAGDGEDLDAVLGLGPEDSGFRPERIGHVVCIEARHTASLLADPIPIEICPTSNLKTKIVQRLEHHPFGTWRNGAAAPTAAAATAGDDNSGDSDAATTAAAASAAASSYPLVVCTDDSGVFNITLSSELHRLATAFHMDGPDLLRLETQALEHAFVGEEHKRRLRGIFEQFRLRQAGTTAGSDSSAAPVVPVPSDPDARPVAILTCLGQDEWKASDRALLAAFHSSGRAAEPVVWNDPSVHWPRFRGVVIRSIWDYHLSDDSLAQLMAVLGRIETEGVPLLNSLETVRWNHSKGYLRQLAQEHGVSTVDTIWVESLAEEGPGLARRIRERGWGDCVIKPLVSASGNLTFRFLLQEDEAAAPTTTAADGPGSSPSLASWSSTLERCMASGVQRWLVQSFCSEVLSEGEWSFVFLNGSYSHCVLSTPAGGRPTAPAWVDPDAPVVAPTSKSSEPPSAEQAANSFMVQAAHGGSFRYVDPDASLIAQAHSMLHATPYGRQSLYARVDCIRRGDKLLLSELELIEPELFGRGVEGFQRKFVDAIEKRLADKTQQQPAC